jgi:ribose transport system substrate-binding protein
MALGAAAAITAAGKNGQLVLAGFDNIAAIHPLLASGRVAVTADQHADALAVYGIEAALQALADGKTGQDRDTHVDIITH